MKILNVVLHNIVERKEDIDDKDFTLTLNKYFEVLAILKNIVRKGFVEDIRIYFDDGYKSFYTLVIPCSQKILSKLVLSITTDFIGKHNFLSLEQVEEIKKKGIRIVSHGVSHTALVIYDKTDKFILKTRKGGKYRNVGFGKIKALSEKEVLFQFIESKKFILQNICRVDEFVFPFGLYNDAVIRINQQEGVYKYLSTCDEYIDKGDYIRPRYLIYNTKSINQIADEIHNLKVK